MKSLKGSLRGDILPPVHNYVGKWNKQGSTQYTLNVATMTQTSDNAWSTARDLMRVIATPPPAGLTSPPGLRATQEPEGGGNGKGEDGNGGEEGTGGTQGAEEG